MALNFPFNKSSSALSNSQTETSSDNEFREAINLFTTHRKKLGITLEELSKKTRISRNVLIAIENGWKKYLPEKTYLTSMIKILEIELDLETGSLNGLSDQKVTINNLSSIEFNFINIDFLNSWVGSLLYFIFMLLAILAINSQQKYLLKINSVSTEPISIEKTNLKKETLINNKKQ
tara:strand:- start:149 stop:679 length:531 start_codon:yes stop_codon:yes gene_type:complete